MGSAKRRLAIQQEQLDRLEHQLELCEKEYIGRKNSLLKSITETKKRRDFQQSLIDGGDTT